MNEISSILAKAIEYIFIEKKELPNGYFLVSDSQIVDFSKSVAEYCSESIEVSKNVAEVFPPNVASAYWALQVSNDSDTVIEKFHSSLNAEGELQTLEFSLLRVPGNECGYVVVFVFQRDFLSFDGKGLDIFKQMVEASTQAIIVSDLNYEITYANSSFANVLEIDESSKVLSRNLLEFCSKESQEILQNTGMPALQTEGKWHGELDIAGEDGSLIPVISSFFTIQNSQNKTESFAGILIDISARKLLETELELYQMDLKSIIDAQTEELKTTNERLSDELDWRKKSEAEKADLINELKRAKDDLLHSSTHDSLTGLFNRRYMEDTIEREVSRCIRSNTALAFLYIDVDKFKHINDVYGHVAGDSYLQAIAEQLTNSCRKEDVPCRYGGDEFVLVMPGAEQNIAVERAHAILEKANNYEVVHGGCILPNISLSIGVSNLHINGKTSNEIILAADEAMYKSKSQGRNKVSVAGFSD